MPCTGVVRLSICALGAILALPAGACDLKVRSGWIRAAPPSASILAAYGVLQNTGAKAVTITSMSTSVAEMVMVHETTVKDGMASMQMIASLSIPPGAAVTLAPGGKHMMLTGLKELPKAGSHVAIAFTDASGCVTQGDFRVRAIAAD
jgi:copper(I)-binding protein